MERINRIGFPIVVYFDINNVAVSYQVSVMEYILYYPQWEIIKKIIAQR